jgi:hypothetical protein
LQTLERQVFQVRLVLMIKVLDGVRLHAGLSLQNIAKSSPQKQEVKLKDKSCGVDLRILRVAASSN